MELTKRVVSALQADTIEVLRKAPRHQGDETCLYVAAQALASYLHDMGHAEVATEFWLCIDQLRDQEEGGAAIEHTGLWERGHA